MRFAVCFLLFLASAFCKPIIVTSIPMQKEFIEAITSDYEVVSLINGGIDPHTFEPKFSDMEKISKAVAYFAIGIEFEDVYLDKFRSQNSSIKIYKNDINIERIYDEHHGHDEHEHHNHSHEHKNGNTHIWLSLKNAKQIADNIYSSLMDLKQDLKYKDNHDKLIAKIDEYDRQIGDILSGIKHSKFVVFHPMLTYFARDYDLEEVSIEVDGKSPKIADMTRVINMIKDEQIKFVFAQREFSDKSAKLIASESGAKLDYFSPLEVPLCENLLDFAKKISGK